MNWSLLFFLNSILLGVGLAMDAFSVSVANALLEPRMKAKRMCIVAGIYALFQFLMPMIGWLCVHTVYDLFESFQGLVPYIALILLLYIGGKMLVEGIKEIHDRKDTAFCEAEEGFEEAAAQRTSSARIVPPRQLLLQGIATSIDALSVGFTIAAYDTAHAVVASLLIGAVTFGICIEGLRIGRKAGERLAGKATIVGGIILILIGIEIWATSVF